MAFTKIVSPGIDTTGSYTVQELNTVGVMTAGTVQVGAATTVHSTGIDLGSGNKHLIILILLVSLLLLVLLDL